MSELKADMLYQEHARLYDAINTHNNTLPSAFNLLATGYGIDQQAVSIAHLTTNHKGDLLKAATSFYLAIAKEMLAASLYPNLRAVGYVEPVLDNAIADVANYYTGTVCNIIHTNFAKTKELFDTVFAQFATYAPPTQVNYTDAGIVELLNKIVIVKNKLIEVQPFFDKVG